MNEFEEIQSQFKLVGSFNEKEDPAASLQRTEAWRKKRNPCFTGSVNSKLMKSGKSSSKMSWNDNNKIFDFAVGVEPFIYEIGMRRNTGYMDQEVSARQMNWGKEQEENLIKQLLKDGIISHHEEADFILHPSIPFLGASPDGLIVRDGEKMVLETKCCVSWAGHYKRKYKRVDEKHDDFWQIQTEIFCAGVKKCLYVVAYPMTTEAYMIEEVEASPIHQNALKCRVEIANQAIENWKSYTKPEALAKAIENYKRDFS